MTCDDCGAALDTARRYCNDRCRLHAMRQRRARQRIIDAGGPKPCRVCGNEVWKYGAIYCGPECRAEANRVNTKLRRRQQVKEQRARETKPEPLPWKRPVQPRARSLAEASR